MSILVGPVTLSATGGTISSITGYTVHRFSTAGSFTFVPRGSGTLEVLVVGGGGASAIGAAGAGGGGAVIYNKLVNVTSGTPYPITVGAVGVANAIGGSSACFGITAFGGGAGSPGTAASGVSSPNASGGGGGGNPGATVAGAGAGVIGLGFPGGTGGPATSNAAGGGGAGAAGTPLGGPGGIGVSYSITGVSSYYGGGGGAVGVPNGGPTTAPLASFGTGNTPGGVIIRYPV